MSVNEVAQGLAKFCREGNWKGAVDAYYSPDIVSIEPMGDNPVSKGRAAVDAKTKVFESKFEIRNAKVDGPFVNGDQFAVEFNMDAMDKSTGKPMPMREIGIYTVKDGKIVEERFFSAC